MDNQNIKLFLATKTRYFETVALTIAAIEIQKEMEVASKEKQALLKAMNFKDPLVAFVLSLILGTFGVDRFYVGDIGLGVLKLITMGGCGVWTIIDWYLIVSRTKTNNMRKLQRVLLMQK